MHLKGWMLIEKKKLKGNVISLYHRYIFLFTTIIKLLFCHSKKINMLLFWGILVFLYNALVIKNLLGSVAVLFFFFCIIK